MQNWFGIRQFNHSLRHQSNPEARNEFGTGSGFAISAFNLGTDWTLKHGTNVELVLEFVIFTLLGQRLCQFSGLQSSFSAMHNRLGSSFRCLFLVQWSCLPIFYYSRTCTLRYVCLTSRIVVNIEIFFCGSLFNTFAILSKCKSVTEMESDVSDSGLPSQISEVYFLLFFLNTCCFE